MKKILIIIIHIIIAFNINAQNIPAIKQGAVNYIKEKCKAPSTFILTDRYGNKISVNKINCYFEKGETKNDSSITKSTKVIDSIIYRKCYKMIDSLVYSHDEAEIMEYYQVIYNPCYFIVFYYEAQNSFGGMVQNTAYVYYDIKKKTYSDRKKYTLKTIGKKYYTINKILPKKRTELYGTEKSNVEYEKKHQKHIKCNIHIPSSCNLCYVEESEHSLHFYSYKSYLSTIDKCRICKKESPNFYHLLKNHKELECLICKELHLQKHAKKKKPNKCKWCEKETNTFSQKKYENDDLYYTKKLINDI